MQLEELGVLVKELREANGMTTEELAQVSGLSYGFISMLENRRGGTPNPKTLEKLAQGFGLHVLVLLGFLYLEEINVFNPELGEVYTGLKQKYFLGKTQRKGMK